MFHVEHCLEPSPRARRETEFPMPVPEANKAVKSKSRLGRGLSSLLSITEPPAAEPRMAPPPVVAAPSEPAGEDGTPATRSSFIEPGVHVVDLPLAAITANPHQPRRQFDERSLAELASSLKSTGMIQPIIVRPNTPADGAYQLIAGERRWRAAGLAEIATVPAIVRDVDGATQAQMALVENIQREDLNPIDRATAYRALLQHLGLTQAELAGRLGEDRSTVTNFLRLLDLPEPVQAFLRDDKLTLGHAKLLAGVTDNAEQQRLAELVVSQGLSVRNLERLIEAGTIAAQNEPKAKEDGGGPSAYLKDLERSLSRQLSLHVQVRASSRRKGHGKLILYYTSLDQFDDLMGRLGAKAEVE